MEWYLNWVKENVMFSSFVQFFILGTIGEILGITVSGKKISKNLVLWLEKAFAWGFLGLVIKYAFTGFTGFIEKLFHKGLLLSSLEENVIFTAFMVSLVMNILFGPQMMFFHRFTDNLIAKTKGFTGIEKSLLTLLWFWIPAHTITFCLPVDFRIGLAAMWSVILGIIMGYFKRDKA